MPSARGWSNPCLSGRHDRCGFDPTTARRTHAVGHAMSELIDVHVTEGSSNEDLLGAARETRADLIVLGRRDGGAACLSHLRQMLRHAPCHVLIVHQSGHAAVA